MGIGALKLTETKEQLSALSRVVSEVLYFTVTLPFSASSSSIPSKLVDHLHLTSGLHGIALFRGAAIILCVVSRSVLDLCSDHIQRLATSGLELWLLLQLPDARMRLEHSGREDEA